MFAPARQRSAARRQRARRTTPTRSPCRKIVARNISALYLGNGSLTSLAMGKARRRWWRRPLMPRRPMIPRRFAPFSGALLHHMFAGSFAPVAAPTGASRPSIGTSGALMRANEQLYPAMLVIAAAR